MRTTGFLCAAALLGAPAPAAADHLPGTAHGVERHYQGLGGPLGAFHDLLEPLWQTASAEARVSGACGQAPEILARAKAVEAGPGSDDYRTAARRLGASAERLKGACERRDSAAVDIELGRLHAFFHGLAGAPAR